MKLDAKSVGDTVFSRQRRSPRMRRLLGLVWSGECPSRVDLSNTLGMTKVSMTSNIARFIDEGIIVETAPIVGKRGRRPIGLKLAPDIFHSVGVNLYKYGRKAVLMNASCEVIDEVPLDDLGGDTDTRLDAIQGMIAALLKRNNIPKDRFIGVGVALPGILDAPRGVVFSSSAFPDAANLKLAALFERRFGATCRLINIPPLLAAVEQRWGVARGLSSFLYLHSGYGLGMYLNGKLYAGHQGSGGLIGSVQIQEHGERGTDGRAGTLGRIAPFHRLTDKLEEILAQNRASTLSALRLRPGQKATIAMVVDAIVQGDQLCAQLMSESFSVVARMAVNLAYIFNPEAIVFEPWTTRCPEVSVDLVRRMMGHYGSPGSGLTTKILSATCGDDDLARGAALLPGAAFLGCEP